MSISNKVNPFNSLTDEVMLPIMQRLGAREFRSLGCVSKYFYSLSSDVSFRLRKWTSKVTVLHSSPFVTCATYVKDLKILVLGYNERRKIQGNLYHLNKQSLKTLSEVEGQIIKQISIDSERKLIIGCTEKTLNVWNLEGHLEQKLDVPEGIEKFIHKANSKDIILRDRLLELKVLTLQNDAKQPIERFVTHINSSADLHHDVQRQRVYNVICPNISVFDMQEQSVLYNIDDASKLSIHSEQKNCLIYLSTQNQLTICDLENLEKNNLHEFQENEYPYKIFYDEKSDHVGVFNTHKIDSGFVLHSIRIWDRKTGERLHLFNIPNSCFPSDIRYLPDLNILLVEHGGTLSVWGLENKKLLREIRLSKNLSINQMSSSNKKLSDEQISILIKHASTTQISYCLESQQIHVTKSNTRTRHWAIFCIQFTPPELQLEKVDLQDKVKL